MLCFCEQSFKGETGLMNGTGNHDGTSRPESREEDTQSIDLEVQSETSEATTVSWLKLHKL